MLNRTLDLCAQLYFTTAFQKPGSQTGFRSIERTRIELCNYYEKLNLIVPNNTLSHWGSISYLPILLELDIIGESRILRRMMMSMPCQG